MEDHRGKGGSGALVSLGLGCTPRGQNASTANPNLRMSPSARLRPKTSPARKAAVTYREKPTRTTLRATASTHCLDNGFAVRGAADAAHPGGPWLWSGNKRTLAGAERGSQTKPSFGSGRRRPAQRVRTMKWSKKAMIHPCDREGWARLACMELWLGWLGWPVSETLAYQY